MLGARIRLEYWSSALNQGPVAARNMIGQNVAYTKIPYFFSEQIASLVASKQVVDVSQLQDPDIDLTTLVGSG